jgi:hypothetical protein
MMTAPCLARAPTPGRGAACIEPPDGRYVYVVRSRRTGRVSIGVDLTPEGACPLACDYCQVARIGPRALPGPIDLAMLDAELALVLARHRRDAGDIAFAGSGEPTWSPAFPEALDLALGHAHRYGGDIPVRVLTSGRTLDRPSVRNELLQLVRSDSGEVWVKLDAWDEASFRVISGARGYASQEARVARFGQEIPFVAQVMLASRPDGPEVDSAIEGIAGVLHRLDEGGALIERVLVTTVLRPPGNAAARVLPVDGLALLGAVRRLRGLGFEVTTPDA